MSASLARLVTGALFLRGGGPSSTPYASTPLNDYYHQPPVGVVVGAGAVGAVTGHLIFHSLLISVGLGVGAMGLAASSEDRAGDIARASGQFALAAFERTAEVNSRYHLTDAVVNGARTTVHRLQEFDREHAVVHRTTEGARKAWRDLKKYDDTHGITARTGRAMSSGLDRLAEALTPPPSTSPKHARRTPNRLGDDKGRGRRERRSGGRGEAWRDGGIGGDGRSRLYPRSERQFRTSGRYAVSSADTGSSAKVRQDTEMRVDSQGSGTAPRDVETNDEAAGARDGQRGHDHGWTVTPCRRVSDAHVDADLWESDARVSRAHGV